MLVGDIGICIEDKDLIGLPLGIAMCVSQHLSNGYESRVYDISNHGKRIDLSDIDKLRSIINLPVIKVKHEHIAYQLYI